MTVVVQNKLEVFDTATPASGGGVLALTLRLNTNTISVRDIIRFRVEQEIENEERDDQAGAFFKQSRRALIPLSAIEETLNARESISARRKRVEPEKYVQRALEAFEENAFFVLADDRQLESLDDEIRLTDSQAVTFYRLVPLVGG